MIWQAVAEQLVLGLVQGGIYALCAVGVALVFGVLDIVNMSHGEFVAIGGYMAVLFVGGQMGNPLLGVVAGTGAAFLLGLAIYPLLIAPMKRRLGRRPAGALFLVLTLGLSIFLQNTMLAVAGGNYLQVPDFIPGAIDLGFTYISNQRLLAGGAALLALGALLAFLRLHREGRAMRAVAQNPEAAETVGINLTRVYSLTLAFSVGLAGLAGALMSPLTTVYPSVGFQFTLKAFAIVILGGLGNVAGALLASFILSICESLSVLFLPTEWQSAIAFVVMILVLLVRPQGLGLKAAI
jgi:branched-chain amino acid transport system permease protein